MGKVLNKIVLLILVVLTTSCNSKTFLNNHNSLSERSDCECSCISDRNQTTSIEDDGMNQSKQFDEDYFLWKTDNQGMLFSSCETYTFDAILGRVPLTFEATIKIPSGYAERAGVLVGNFGEDQAIINFEIHTFGNPRLYYRNTSGETYDYIFSKVSVNTGERLHLVIVDDPTTGLFKCYINGIVKQTLPNTFYKNKPSTKLRVGSDARYLNGQYFKGTLYNVALFSSIRNEKEIANDISEIDTADDNLLAAFETTEEKSQSNIKSINDRYNLIYESKWLTDVDTPSDYSYSFAVIGDTQTMAYRWPNEFHCIYDYVLDNKQRDKISYCIGLGDITEKDTDFEWELAKNRINTLNGYVPYSLNRGNHDSLTKFNYYFGKQDDYYYSTISGCFVEDSVENSYKTVVVENQKYLIFSLDFGATDDVLKWADNVMKQYQNYHVVITTHAYLFRDGTTLDSNDICPPSTLPGLNNGDDIWDKLISKHNIDLVLCGHDPTDGIVITKTKNNQGKNVAQILVNPQDIDLGEPAGMIAMFYFSNDGNTIDIRYYSTVKKMWYGAKNQTTIQLNSL